MRHAEPPGGVLFLQDNPASNDLGPPGGFAPRRVPAADILALKSRVVLPARKIRARLAPEIRLFFRLATDVFPMLRCAPSTGCVGILSFLPYFF